MKKTVFISLVLISIFSCDNKFPEYQQKEDGVYMNLLSFDEGKKTFKDNYYTKATIQISSNKKLIYQHFPEEIITPNNDKFNFILAYLTEGDSANFKIFSKIIKKQLANPSLNDIQSDYINLTIKIHQYLSPQEYKKMNTIFDDEMKEQLLLKKYLKENNITSKNFINGIYVQQLEEGTGQKISKGNSITINYKGYFINQLEFDNSYKDIPLTFIYGTPDQVIKGLNIAIKEMKKGEKSKIIIPSQLAFGEEGSTTDIVPAFTTVIYELEIVNVK